MPQDEVEALSPLPVKDDGRHAGDGARLGGERRFGEQRCRVGRPARLDERREAQVVGALLSGGGSRDIGGCECVVELPLRDGRYPWSIEGRSQCPEHLHAEKEGDEDENKGTSSSGGRGVGESAEDVIEDDDGQRGWHVWENVLRGVNIPSECPSQLGEARSR